MAIYAKMAMETLPESCSACRYGHYQSGVNLCHLTYQRTSENPYAPKKERPKYCPLVESPVDADVSIPSNTLSYSDLLRMDGEPVFITCHPDAAGEQLKLWALVSVEDDEVLLRNSLGGCSSYEEMASKIEKITAMPSPPNRLLTLSELKTREEPFFIRLKDGTWPGTGFANCGYASIKFNKSETAEASLMGWDCPMQLKLSEYGKSWVAYLRKPENF